MAGKKKQLYWYSLLPQCSVHLFRLTLGIRGVALPLKQPEGCLRVFGVGQRALSPCALEVPPRLSGIPAVSVGSRFGPILTELIDDGRAADDRLEGQAGISPP